MQGPAPIPVFRPSYLTDGLEFQGSLTESPANIFYQRVSASRASISAQGSGRFQFQWRSVSDNLLMSPTVMLRFKLSIACPVLWNQVTQYLAVNGVRAAKGALNEANTYAAGTAGANTGNVGSAAICFADGDAFTNCCSSINFSFNGTSLSLNRTNYFWRDWMRTQISSKDAARIEPTTRRPDLSVQISCVFGGFSGFLCFKSISKRESSGKTSFFSVFFSYPVVFGVNFCRNFYRFLVFSSIFSRFSFEKSEF